MKEEVPVSADEVAAYKELFAKSNRPTQPVNDRVVSVVEDWPRVSGIGVPGPRRGVRAPGALDPGRRPAHRQSARDVRVQLILSCPSLPPSIRSSPPPSAPVLFNLLECHGR